MDRFLLFSILTYGYVNNFHYYIDLKENFENIDLTEINQ